MWCERRIENWSKDSTKNWSYVENAKKSRRGPGVGRGGQGECERRIEVIVKMKKSRGGGGVVQGGGGEGQCGCEIEVIVKMKK